MTLVRLIRDNKSAGQNKQAMDQFTVDKELCNTMENLLTAFPLAASMHVSYNKRFRVYDLEGQLH